MLGRQGSTREESARGRELVREPIAAYRKLAGSGAPAAVEPLVTRTLVLALDRAFVHRIRKVTGKDATPVDEVELLAESLLRGATLERVPVVTDDAERSVTAVAVGTPITLDVDATERLVEAFFDDLEARLGPARPAHSRGVASSGARRGRGRVAGAAGASGVRGRGTRGRRPRRMRGSWMR